MNERYLLLLFLTSLAVIAWTAGEYFTEPLSYAIDAIVFWPLWCCYLFARREATR